MSSGDRDAARRRFLADAGWAQAHVHPLQPDASFRCYFRVRDGQRSAMLMDAPPPRENPAAFVRVATHLASLGLHPPALYANDPDRGFLLLEDFGDDTYTRLLAGGADERALYSMAVDVLTTLHGRPDAAAVDLPAYDAAALVNEALLLVDWYYPAVHGNAASEEARRGFVDIWHELLNALPVLPPTLVLRDYHVDNLMRVTGSDGSVHCGLLDFQDAVLGSPAYDLMSLLEDARRDVPDALADEMLRRYYAGVHTTDQQAFDLHYRVLAAQRHCKVAGIFVRLCHRDGKCGYLTHIPRVVRMLQKHLASPVLDSLRNWLDTHLPARHEVRIAVRREVRGDS